MLFSFYLILLLTNSNVVPTRLFLIWQIWTWSYRSPFSFCFLVCAWFCWNNQPKADLSSWGREACYHILGLWCGPMHTLARSCPSPSLLLSGRPFLWRRHEFLLLCIFLSWHWFPLFCAHSSSHSTASSYFQHLRCLLLPALWVAQHFAPAKQVLTGQPMPGVLVIIMLEEQVLELLLQRLAVSIIAAVEQQVPRASHFIFQIGQMGCAPYPMTSSHAQPCAFLFSKWLGVIWQ